MLPKLSLFIALTLFLTSPLNADSDIDFSNGTVLIETDHHDDIVMIDYDDDYEKVVVYIIQMNDFFNSPFEAYQLFHLFSPAGTTAGIYEYFKNSSGDHRIWRRDKEDVDRIVIRTMGGNDAVRCNVAADLWVYGGHGDDYLTGGLRRAILFGDAGNDFLRNHNHLPAYIYQYATNYIFGGTGDDEIDYNAYSTVFIDGGDGNDEISLGVRSANSIIRGGEGNDVIFGGLKKDTIYAGPGDDEVSGSLGDDIIYGGDGLDTLYGGSGNDYLEGGYDGAPDLLNGQDGHDEAIGYYYRFASSRFSNKNLIVRLEEEVLDNIEITSGRQR